MKNKKYWFCALAAFLIDLSTKILALYFLNCEEEFPINYYFSLQRVWNESTILATVSFNVSIIFFRIIWVMFALLLALSIYWVSVQPEINEDNHKTKLAKSGLFLIMSGIWGNCFDRIFRHDGVIDFIRLNWFDNMIPIMNFADLFIYIGIFCILISWCLIIKETLFIKYIKK